MILLEAVMTSVLIMTQAEIIRTTFNNDLEVIAPCVSEQVRLELKSEFLQVDSKTDFENLMGKIKPIAGQHKLRLQDQ
jgi:hypothetical protein